MAAGLPGNTSGMVRLMLGVPEYAPGWQELLYVADPAAGEYWSHTVDGRYHERLLAVTFDLVTSSTAANRYVSVQLKDTNGQLVTSVPASGAVVASSTATPCLTTDGPAYASATSGTIPGMLPDILAAPGWVWSTAGFNLQSGDQISAVALLVQRYPNDVTALVVAG